MHAFAALALAGCDPAADGAEFRDSYAASDGQDPCGHRTQTQHGWGQACSGVNLGCLRDAQFPKLYPEGLYVGCGEKTINMLNGAAVAAALPSSGPARALTLEEAGAYDGTGDPVVTTTLLGEVVALELNLGFDELQGFKQFSPSTALADLYVTDPLSPCVDMQVRDVLDQANAALGGCDSKLSPEVARQCVAAINAAFIHGKDAEGDPLCSAMFEP